MLPYGSRAVLLECADLADVLSLQPVIRERVGAITEVTPGARTLLLRSDRQLTAAEKQLLLIMPGTAPTSHDDHQTQLIKVTYDGPDLEAVAGHLGLSVAEVITIHTEQLWTVAFCGFAPGFGYLIGAHSRLRVPRLSSPRTTVPAGSVGLADVWSGIYPRSGPGGWRLIGTTDADLWNLDRDQPALLRPGVRVRFQAVGRP